MRIRVCVQSSDCQCCTTVQVEQCRMIRDTEGQRGGGRKMVREGDRENEEARRHDAGRESTRGETL